MLYTPTIKTDLKEVSRINASDPTTVESGADINESSEAVSGVTEDGGEPVPAPADFPSPTVTAVVPSTGA
ncbi:hypothetical protein J6590_064775, partial [Homalodisca vitripennis]